MYMYKGYVNITQLVSYLV